MDYIAYLSNVRIESFEVLDYIVECLVISCVGVI